MEIKNFLKKHNLTENQFYGKEKILGSLYLSGLTSIPEGFNPTVGSSLDLRGLTSIPVGFNPTVGGYLDLSGLTSIPEGFNPTVGGSLYLSGLTSNYRTLNENEILFWASGYLKADGIFSKILSKKRNYYKIQSLTNLDISYLYTDGKCNAHGKTLREAKNNFDFKISINEIKNKKIKPDDLIDVNTYRALTGACEFGVNLWKQENGITNDKIKADDLLILLEKTQAYGLEKFKKLIEK